MEPSWTILPLLLAVAAAVATTPLAARLARALRAVDEPTERSVSLRPGIPLLGGLAVAAGFAVGFVASVASLEVFVVTQRLWGALAGASLVLALGVLDDRRGLGAPPKFGIQIVAALLAVGSGMRIDYLTDPLTRESLTLPSWLGGVVSVLWIVGITNAINLIDGLDGLATGVAAIICATLTVIAWQGGHLLGVCMGIGLLGGLLGFLPWNFPPARIFLGDTGSLFVGYMLSVVALEGYRQAVLLPFVVPVLALGVPILDTALSIVRRLRLHAPVFSADRLHMHHRLLETRGSTRAAVLQFYFVTACFGLIALSFTRLHGAVAVVCLAAVGLLTLRMLWNLGALSFGAPETAGGPQSGREGEP